MSPQNLVASPRPAVSVQPPIIQYTNLLHQYRDPNAEPVKEFVAQHSHDPVFLKRVAVLNKVWRLKETLVVAGRAG